MRIWKRKENEFFNLPVIKNRKYPNDLLNKKIDVGV